MPRLKHNGPGLSYIVCYRNKGSLYWTNVTVRNPNQKQVEIDVDDVYGLYEVKVQAQNAFGNAFQPAFVTLGRSGEAGKVIGFY